MSRYGKHPRLSLEEEGVNFQDPLETDELPLVPTAEKEEREGEEEVKEEDNNKLKNEEDNIKKQEDDEAKGKKDGEEHGCDEVDEGKNETGEEEIETGKEENETGEEETEAGEEENEAGEEENEAGKEETEAGEEETEAGEEENEAGKEETEAGEEETEAGEEETEAGEEESDIASIFFSSNISLPSFTPPSPSSSSSSSSSFFSLLQNNLGGNEGYSPGMLSIFQNAQSFFPSSALGGNLDEGTSYQAESSPEDSEALLNIVIQEKATDLVFLFIYKYRMKEPITLSEIYEVVTKDYENHFPVIFMEASKCLEMTFGIDIKESELLSSAYVFVNSLNLTYEDMLSDNDRLPRNAFLIVILGVIFIEGNCASEERIWEFLKLVGVHDGEEHFICGDPREFLTIDLVQQHYLEYRQVPDSQPPCFEFLWGPRAYAETTKMKVLEFLAKMNGCDPTDFSVWYEEALREEEERAWAMNDSADGSPTSWLVER